MVSRLRELLERRQAAEKDAHDAADAFYLAVYQASDVEGATRQQLADALGVGISTVQGWVVRGRVLAGNPPDGG